MKTKIAVLSLVLSLSSCVSENYKIKKSTKTTYVSSGKLVKDIEARKLAISKMTFGPSLTEIAKTDKDPEVRKVAVKRLNQLN